MTEALALSPRQILTVWEQLRPDADKVAPSGGGRHLSLVPKSKDAIEAALSNLMATGSG